MTHEDREYHLRRARAELDMAHRSSCRVAADAHMKLSMLHMERVRQGNARVGAAIDPDASACLVGEGAARLRGI